MYIIIFVVYIVVGFNPSTYSVNERPGSLVPLVVTRSGNTDLPASVTLRTVPGTADGRQTTHSQDLCRY